MHGKEKGSIFAGNNLKPFGKMKTFLIIFGIVLFVFGLYGYAIACFFFAYLFRNGSNTGTGGKYNGDDYFVG